MYERKKNRKIILIDIIIGFVGAVLIAFINKQWIPNMALISEIDKTMLLDIIITQYTITFLIVSLLSLLSSHGEYIYWIDVLEQKIIAPKHLNFISMSVYSFITLLVGTIAFFMNDVKLVLIYFFIDVICLVFLTFRMIDIFFGRERLQNRLRKKMLKEVQSYIDNPHADKLKLIEEKLYGIYENANKLAEKNEFAQIIDTDFQLLVDISELMKEKYDSNLAKVIYSNIGKLLLIFQGNNDFIFHILYERYQPFGNSALSRHTLEMIQSALFDFFERVLARGEYSISQDYWICRIYRNLKNTFEDMVEESLNTIIIIEKEHYNYEGEILFEEEVCEKDLVDYNLRDMKLNLVHEKLIRFSELIFQNSPNAFFQVIKQYGIPSDIQKELRLIGRICEYDRLNSAEKTLHKICRQHPVFIKDQKMREQNDFTIISQISEAMGDKAYVEKLTEQMNKNTCAVSDEFMKLFIEVALLHKSLRMTCALLQNFESLFWDYRHNHLKNTMMKMDEKFHIEDEKFYDVLSQVKEQFKEDVKLINLFKRVDKLFHG